MLKKILLASLLALGLNAAPLAVDSVVDNLKIKDQNEVENAKIGLNRTTMQELDRTQKRSLTGQ
jgi:hypothetical protein